MCFSKKIHALLLFPLFFHLFWSKNNPLKKDDGKTRNFKAVQCQVYAVKCDWIGKITQIEMEK